MKYIPFTPKADITANSREVVLESSSFSMDSIIIPKIPNFLASSIQLSTFSNREGILRNRANVIRTEQQRHLTVLLSGKDLKEVRTVSTRETSFISSSVASIHYK